MRTFTCAGCGYEFNATNDPEDVTRARESLYADEPLAEGDEYVSVCDACHRDTLMWIVTQPDREVAARAFKLLRSGFV